MTYIIILQVEIDQIKCDHAVPSGWNTIYG